MCASLSAAAILALSLIALPAAAQDEPADPNDSTDLRVAVTPGEVLLTGSDVTTINDSSLPTAYRICLDRERGHASLAVRVDGFDAAVIGLGACRIILGKQIEITPLTTLRGDEQIVASYQQLPTYEASAAGSSER